MKRCDDKSSDSLHFALTQNRVCLFTSFPLIPIFSSTYYHPYMWSLVSFCFTHTTFIPVSIITYMYLCRVPICSFAFHYFFCIPSRALSTLLLLTNSDIKKNKKKSRQVGFLASSETKRSFTLFLPLSSHYRTAEELEKL